MGQGRNDLVIDAVHSPMTEGRPEQATLTLNPFPLEHDTPSAMSLHDDLTSRRRHSCRTATKLWLISAF